MGLLLFYLFLALFISFLCSIAEAVILSTPISFLKAADSEGNKNSRKMLQYKEDIDKPLAAILSLNTVAHTIGAAGVGAQSVEVFGEAYFGVISAVLTILILVFTEIIPKTIGARFWRYLVSPVYVLVRIMIFIAYPLVIVSSGITRLMAEKKPGLSTSREEISALANIGTEEGILGSKENKIIQNLIRLKSLRVTEILTPRVVVSTADENMALSDFLKDKEYLRFSRIPIYSGNEDHITGYVFRQEVFEKLAENKSDLKLKDLKRKIVVLTAYIQVFDAWETLIKSKEHLALIVNEYGGMDGILTMEDIIETLVGFEIMDEKDTISDMQQYAKERWKMRQEKYKLMDFYEGKTANGSTDKPTST